MRMWTSKEEQSLLYYYSLGMPLSDIAIELSRTVNSINQKLKNVRKGYHKKPWSDEDCDTLVSMANDGYSLGSICNKLKRSKWSIDRKLCNLRKVGVSANRTRFKSNGKSFNEFRKYYDMGMSPKQISERVTSVSLRTIYKYVGRL